MAPSGSKLYRSLRGVVLLVVVAVCTHFALAQYGRKNTASAGPRAVGLVEMAANGNARLVPVLILYDGKFFDAAAYKANPVPMALEPGTVYEGFRAGVSQGLFTITNVLQGPHIWLGAGNWVPAGSAPPPKKEEGPPKDPTEEVDAPPVLKRPGAKPSDSGSTSPPAAQPAPPPPAATPAPAPPPEPPKTTPAPAPDSDAPVLRRGLPTKQQKPDLPSATTPISAKAAEPGTKKDGIQIIPAISDAGGPEAKPYAYLMKGDEEQLFRKKMLALAADEVRARARAISGQPAPAPTSAKGKTAAKGPQPTFSDIDFRVFDLTTSNEPVLVLGATAQMPASTGVQYYVMLVAREDIYGDLHKALANIADTQHLDVLSRMDLIDAVDADGDGRGELLFRQMSDSGHAYVLYRVIGNQLYALYQSEFSQ